MVCILRIEFNDRKEFVCTGYHLQLGMGINCIAEEKIKVPLSRILNKELLQKRRNDQFITSKHEMSPQFFCEPSFHHPSVGGSFPNHFARKPVPLQSEQPMEP